MCKKRHAADPDDIMRTRCGERIINTHIERTFVVTDPRKVTCKHCLDWLGKPHYGRGRVATIRDGMKIPYSSLESLERPRPAPNYGSNPRPGPPYPWEIANVMGTGE